VNAIPEFETRPRQMGSGLTLNLGPLHHPDCRECCALNRCHWCLNRPENGTITSKGEDGFVYSACKTHLQYFAEMQNRTMSSAGVDLRAGLEHLAISDPPLLTR